MLLLDNMKRTTPLLRFIFNYNKFDTKIPIIKVKLNNSVYIDVILDCGADRINISKKLANELKLKLKKLNKPITTAGGEKQAYTSTLDTFILGQNEREVVYKNVKIYVIDGLTDILIGMEPVFDDYDVKIMGYKRKVIFNPKKV